MKLEGIVAVVASVVALIALIVAFSTIGSNHEIPAVRQQLEEAVDRRVEERLAVIEARLEERDKGYREEIAALRSEFLEAKKYAMLWQEERSKITEEILAASAKLNNTITQRVNTAMATMDEKATGLKRSIMEIEDRLERINEQIEPRAIQVVNEQLKKRALY